MDHWLQRYTIHNKKALVHYLKHQLLEVDVSDAFHEFYYAGPFWEEFVPIVLLDIIDEEKNTRKEHGFPKKYIVLSEMSANAVLVLDTITDKVYTVNFEGGDELLLKGELTFFCKTAQNKR